MRKINVIMLVANLVVFGLVLIFFDAQAAGIIQKGDWEYKDLVAVLLTVVTVALTFIGLIVAGAAIWGYQSIRSIAERKAEETSRSGVDDYLHSEHFKSGLDVAIRERLDAEAKTAVQDALAPAVVRSDQAPEYHPKEGSALSGLPVSEAQSEDVQWRD